MVETRVNDQQAATTSEATAAPDDDLESIWRSGPQYKSGGEDESGYGVTLKGSDGEVLQNPATQLIPSMTSPQPRRIARLGCDRPLNKMLTICFNFPCKTVFLLEKKKKPQFSHLHGKYVSLNYVALNTSEKLHRNSRASEIQCTLCKVTITQPSE